MGDEAPLGWVRERGLRIGKRQAKIKGLSPRE
jgi:hypothetical protein